MLQTADGQNYNVVSIPFLVNMYPSSSCFMGLERAHARFCLWPVAPKLQTLYPSSADKVEMKNLTVSIISLGIVILAAHCDANIINCNV